MNMCEVIKRGSVCHLETNPRTVTLDSETFDSLYSEIVVEAKHMVLQLRETMSNEPDQKHLR